MNNPRTNKILYTIFIIIIIAFFLSSCSYNQSINTHEINNQPETTQENKAEPIIRFEGIIIVALIIASMVSVGSRWARIPYTVGLVLVGLGMAFFRQSPLSGVPPELILALMIPPLVFEAAFRLDFNELQRDIKLVLILAVPGVLLTTFLVGGVISIGTGMGFAIALVFGSLISATDPVSVVALFRSIGSPKRLQVLLEGESLLNDGTAIVIFGLMIGIVSTGKFRLLGSLADFLLVSGGGIMVGVTLGYLIALVMGHINDHLVETTLTTVLAYSSYLIADELLGVSGVLAVVAAGLTVGNLGFNKLSPSSRIIVDNFWDYAAFLANSFVFLLIGLQINLYSLLNNAAIILWSILAVLIARAVSIYGLSILAKNKIPLSWKNVLFWGGLRGAVSLALALSLTADIQGYEHLQAMAFGVVLFSLLVQGLSMEQLIKKMKLVFHNESRDSYMRNHARAVTLRAAHERLSSLHKQGLVSDYTWKKIEPILNKRSKQLSSEVIDVLDKDPLLQDDELNNIWKEALHTQRSKLTALFREGVISEKIYAELGTEIDTQIDDNLKSWSYFASDKS